MSQSKLGKLEIEAEVMNTDLKRKMEDMGTTGEAQKRPRQGEDECSKCGGTGHPMSRCTSPKGANEQCHNCGGYSHMMSVCPSPKGAKLGCHICSGKGHQVPRKFFHWQAAHLRLYHVFFLRLSRFRPSPVPITGDKSL